MLDRDARAILRSERPEIAPLGRVVDDLATLGARPEVGVREILVPAVVRRPGRPDAERGRGQRQAGQIEETAARE